MEKNEPVLPEYVSAVLNALSAAGFHGYLVGGSLRDMLRGVKPHDFDLTTDATPDEMLSVFAAFRTFPTGLKHGTLTVLSDGHPVEVTTHRVDGAYSDSRHPAAVRFTASLAEDLSRRDFTVNAMAWSRETGLVDLFDGARDLAAGVLRAVGDPEKRFREDALRILRLFRFAAQLDFEIDPATARGAAAEAPGLANISAERIFGELTRTLTGKAAARGISGLCACGCVPYVFGDTVPDLSVLPAFEKMPSDPAVRFAALVFPHGEEKARGLCRKLRSSNAFSHTVCGVIEAMGEKIPQTEFEARRFVCTYYESWRAAFAVLAAECAGAEERPDAQLSADTVSGADAQSGTPPRVPTGAEVRAGAILCERVVRDRTAVDLHRLAVNGVDLQQKAGIRTEKTAKTLRYLQELVWHEPQQNKKAALIAAAIAYAQKEESENG